MSAPVAASWLSALASWSYRYPLTHLLPDAVEASIHFLLLSVLEILQLYMLEVIVLQWPASAHYLSVPLQISCASHPRQHRPLHNAVGTVLEGNHPHASFEATLVAATRSRKLSSAHLRETSASQQPQYWTDIDARQSICIPCQKDRLWGRCRQDKGTSMCDEF